MSIIFLFFMIYSVNILAAGQDECRPESCSPTGPIIRFPFRLKARQPERCGYPGFDLSCNPSDNATEFEFQFPVRASARNVILPVSAKARVEEIEYAAQVIRMSVANGSCLPGRVPEESSSPSPSPSPSPFELYKKPLPYYSSEDGGYTLFNCSGEVEVDDSTRRGWGPISCLNRGNYRVYAYSSFSFVENVNLSRCVKVYNVSNVPEVLLGENSVVEDDTYLHWAQPACGACQGSGNYCGFNTTNQIQCFHVYNRSQRITKRAVIAVVVVGVLVMALALGFAIYTWSVNRKRESYSYKDDSPSKYARVKIMLC